MSQPCDAISPILYQVGDLKLGTENWEPKPGTPLPAGVSRLGWIEDEWPWWRPEGRTVVWGLRVGSQVTGRGMMTDERTSLESEIDKLRKIIDNSEVALVGPMSRQDRAWVTEKVKLRKTRLRRLVDRLDSLVPPRSLPSRLPR